jgi:hypothetical protein
MCVTQPSSKAGYLPLNMSDRIGQQSLGFGQSWDLMCDTTHPVHCAAGFMQDAVVIGARLDFDSTGDSCRLAFYGRLLAQLGSGGPQELQRLQVFKVRGGCTENLCL